MIFTMEWNGIYDVDFVIMGRYFPVIEFARLSQKISISKSIQIFSLSFSKTAFSISVVMTVNF